LFKLLFEFQENDKKLSILSNIPKTKIKKKRNKNKINNKKVDIYNNNCLLYILEQFDGYNKYSLQYKFHKILYNNITKFKKEFNKHIIINKQEFLNIIDETLEEFREEYTHESYYRINKSIKSKFILDYDEKLGFLNVNYKAINIYSYINLLKEYILSSDNSLIDKIKTLDLNINPKKENILKKITNTNNINNVLCCVKGCNKLAGEEDYMIFHKICKYHTFN
jgi:hypothetical protein